MKTFRNTLLAFAAVGLVMPVFNGCKKGAEDPFISLKSRDSRLVGEWTVSAYTKDSKKTEIQKFAASGSQGAYQETTVTTETITGDASSKTTNTTVNWSTTESGLPTGSPTSVATTDNKTESEAVEVNILKDGTYTWKMSSKSNPTARTSTKTSTPANTCTVSPGLICDGSYTYTFTNTYDDTDEGTGEWVWANSKKNKTDVTFVTGLWAGQTFNVLQLKGKEVIFEKVTTSKTASTSPSSTDVDETSTEKWTLTAK